jgi:hypothetical protein
LNPSSSVLKRFALHRHGDDSRPQATGSRRASSGAGFPGSPSARLAQAVPSSGRPRDNASFANIRFDDLRHLLRHLGFAERIRGDHYIFTKDGIAEILNLQPRGRQAKPYQVKQVRGVMVKYHLAGGDDAK